MCLREDQVQAFREEGVLVAEGVLTVDDLAPVRREYEEWIDRGARELHQEGKIEDLAEGADFTHRFARLFAQSEEIAAGTDVMQMRGPATFAFMRNPHLLDAVDCLIGREITCSPIQHIRAKPPAAATGEGTGFYNVPGTRTSA